MKSSLDPEWKPWAEALKPGDSVKCLYDAGYYQLTEGKEYIVHIGVEAGIFADRPFLTVLGDNGKPVCGHASRFIKP